MSYIPTHFLTSILPTIFLIRLLPQRPDQSLCSLLYLEITIVNYSHTFPYPNLIF